jgi:dipeptidyl aminopeptidase/acylaminoacyl peptidase
MKAIPFKPFVTASLFLLVNASIQAQKTAIIRPGDNLIVKNIPELSTEIATEVRRYTESRSASAVDWHPTRREMLITTRFGNTAQLHYLKNPMGARTQITFFEEPVGNATFEPTSGNYFIFTRDVGGNEFAQMYRYDLSDGRTTLISDGGRSQNGNIRWNKTGDRILFSSTRRNGADRDIWMMRPMDPASASMVMEVKGGGWNINDWSADEKKILISEGLSVNESHLYVYDVISKTKLEIGPSSKKEKVVNGSARYSIDGKHIFFITDFGSDYRRLARMNADGSDIRYLTSDIKWDVAGYDLKDDGTRILFTTNEDGLGKVYVLETVNLTWQPITSLPKGQIGGASWRPKSEDFVFGFSSASNNSDIYTYSFETFKVERWTESELGGIVASNLRDEELIRWKSFDGLEISGFLYRPNSKFTGKRPVIINIHGGPESQSRPGFQGRNNYFLEELGIAIIYPNVRGSTGYGKKFVTLDNGYLRENSVKDIGALIDWISTQPDLDKDRIMVTGGSYGGYMSLAVSVMYADKIRCAIDVVGISNFVTFLKNTEDYRRDLRRVEYGDERDPKMNAFLEKISPNNNASSISKPLFIVQGGNDPRVPRTEAEQMFNTLNSTGKPVWYLEAKDEGHGFRKKNNVDFQFYATVEFIKRYLLNK